MNGGSQMGSIQFLSTRYWLTDGTMLGYQREHGIISRDDDADICVARDDLKRACLVLQRAQQESWPDLQAVECQDFYFPNGTLDERTMFNVA